MATAENKHDLEIPVWVKGTQKWVTGLTKRTTCDDVIYALLYQDGVQHRTSEYAIFEKWREVERPLQGRTKIVKVWRTWGAEQSNVHLSMRRIDELEYSGDFSLTRRKKRSRHRKSERDRHSRDHHRHHSYCHNTSERLRSMEGLVKLVISQERKLKDFKEQIDDTNKLIDKYESKVHMTRLKQNGEDYVQDAYLESYSEDSMDDMLSNVDADTLEKYLELCDKVIAIEDQIVNEHLKLDDLSSQLQQSYSETNSDAAGGEQDEVNQVQVQLNRAVSCAIMQQYKFQDVQRELQFYDDKLRHKENLMQRLQQELKDIESNESEMQVRPKLESASSNSSLESSQSSGYGGVRPKNPLPVPEKNPVPLPESSLPPPLPERTKHKVPMRDSNPESPHEPVLERKPILKVTNSEPKNGYYLPPKPSAVNETKVRFKTESLVDKYCWDESSSEGISIDHSDCSDLRDPFDIIARKDTNYWVQAGVADKPYQTVKVEDNDSNSDTGLSSMHSDDSAVYHLETLV